MAADEYVSRREGASGASAPLEKNGQTNGSTVVKQSTTSQPEPGELRWPLEDSLTTSLLEVRKNVVEYDDIEPGEIAEASDLGNLGSLSLSQAEALEAEVSEGEIEEGEC